MNETYLLLGSNMGNSRRQLDTAIDHIEKKLGRVNRKSRLYATEAWGNIAQPDFLNQVLVVSTTCSARETLGNLLAIEKKMGRVRTIKNAPRIIDIDILFFNQEIILEDQLSIPHPQIPNRRFVLVPLVELSPGFIHPASGKDMQQLLNECADPLNVKECT